MSERKTKVYGEIKNIEIKIAKAGAVGGESPADVHIEIWSTMCADCAMP